MNLLLQTTHSNLKAQIANWLKSEPFVVVASFVS
jgi:hypothetical protein